MDLKKFILYLFFLGIGIYLLVILIHGVEDKEGLGKDMRSAPIWAISITFSMGLLAVISRGIRWILLLEPLGYKPSKLNAVSSVAFGYLVNLLIPRSGEVARCTALHSTDDIPVDKLLGTVITERVVDFIMLFIFLSVAVITNYEAVFSFMPAINVYPDPSIIVFGVLAILVSVFGIVKLIQRSKRSSNHLIMKIVSFISGVGVGIRSVSSMKNRGVFFAHTLFIWAMYFLMSYALFVSMDGLFDMGVFEGLWVMVCGGFGMVFPAPGGVGAYQYAVQQGFISIGIDGDLGFAVANVVWITQTIMLIVSGILGYIILHLAHKSKSS